MAVTGQAQQPWRSGMTPCNEVRRQVGKLTALQHASRWPGLKLLSNYPNALEVF